MFLREIVIIPKGGGMGYFWIIISLNLFIRFFLIGSNEWVRVTVLEF